MRPGAYPKARFDKLSARITVLRGSALLDHPSGLHRCEPQNGREYVPRRSTGEHAPADIVSLSLIVDDEVTDR
jgi:hypothetical protein